MMESPALSVRTDFSDMDDEQLELYLAGCVPLSNLPTPPPAKEQLPLTPLPSPSVEETQRYSAELEVYATHLANLVPWNVSGVRPTVPIICGFLERARLPVEMVAFAACVLDALSSRFAVKWREAWPPAQPACDQFYLGENGWQWSSVSPNLIVLSALALAHGFIDDRGRSNSHWSRIEAAGRFTAQEVEVTKMCILQDIEYGLFRIDEEMVQRMVRDMQRAFNVALPSSLMARKDSIPAEKDGRRPRLSLSTDALGIAIWAHGVQTPEPSP